MAVVAQRKGVRLIGFQKAGHTSLINMFLTPAGTEIRRGGGEFAPVVRNSADEAAAFEARRGDIATARRDWPKADYTLAFFRHPIARSLSAYQHFLVRAPVTAGYQHNRFLKLGFDADMTFNDFCEHLKLIDITADPHLKPQYMSFEEGQSGQAVMCRLEEIEVMWPWAVDALGLECTTDVVQYNSASYDQRYGARSGRILADLYAGDLHYWEHAIRGHETRTAIPPISDEAPE